jgi:AcrR family transcriptional regulator
VPVRAGTPLDPTATRERILRVSERVLYERGINAVGVADIAKASGASKASIYKNFGSKEGLVEATLRYRSDRVHRWLAEGTAHLPPGTGQVLGVFDLLLAWYAEDGFRGCAMVSAAAEHRVADSAATRLARHHLQAYRNFLVRTLREAGAEDADARELAAMLLVLIEGATVIASIDGTTDAGQHARAVALQLLTPLTAS